jgi:predicted Zn-dependent protease
MLEKGIRDAICSVRDHAAKRGIRASFGLHREDSHLMRIGNSSVSLSTSERLTRLDVGVVDGRREGSHTHMTEVTSPEVVERALQIALGKAKASAEKDYEPMLPEVRQSIEEEPQLDPAVTGMDPAVKAEGYAEIFRGAGEDYNYSGSWSSGRSERFLVSTAGGNEAYHAGTDWKFSVVLKHPEAKWELQHGQTGWRADDFDPMLSVESFRRYIPVYAGNDGVRVEEGDYTVIFGAEALADICAMGVFTGLSGRMWEEKLGWTSGREPGQRILGENITVIDDPTNDLTFRMGFDMGGMVRRPFTAVEDGVMRNLFYDMATAAKYGREPTGHDTGSPSLVLHPGSGPENPLEAVRGMGRVLYVPALHYMNMPSMARGIFTGSSRFSATMVEDGEIVAPIFSTRITDTFEKVLSRVKTLSSVAVSQNQSNTYERRSPRAMSVPSYAVVENVKVTDCADSF